MIDLDKVMERIQALINQAESTTFPEEQKTFWSKANAMMLQYAIDEAQLRAAGKADEQPVLEEWNYAGKSPGMLRYQRASKLLAAVVAKNNRCRTIFHKATGTATICGFQSDINFVSILYSSLWVQALIQSMALSSQRQLFLDSFFDGFAAEIDSRLKEADEEVVQGGVGNALVLYDIQKVVDAAYNKAFPNRGHLARRSDASTYAAGVAAGRNADISGGRNAISNQRGLPK